ncbi:MAG: hypothetical protein JO214_14585 [Frankiaceae bacterium]|nr:hypothetical protein [Frankiaceae bacterium]
MSSLVAATGRTDDEPGKASGPSRDPEECTRRGLEQLVKDRGLGVDVDELLGFAYDLNDDPWRGYLLIKALTEKGLGANRAATVRSRIARAIRENAGAA